MMECITIAQAKAALKGSIIAKVVHLGNISSGTGAKGEWQKQVATLKDNSETQEMTLWNEDIGRLDQGQILVFEQPYWTMYKEKPQLSLGNYCKLTIASESDMLDVVKPDTTVDSFLENKQQDIKKHTEQQLADIKLQFLPERLEEIDKELTKLMVIETIVTQKLSIVDLSPNPAKIGMYMKFINDFLENKE